jgi:hypothetical protein
MGARWLYSESWMKDAKAPYMQRVSRVVAEPDGTISVQRFAIPAAERFVGAWQEPARFAALTPSDLEVLAGCNLVFVRTGKDRFAGGAIGNRCRNADKGPAYAVSQATVSALRFTNWDRGFTADGTQTRAPNTVAIASGASMRRAAAPIQSGCSSMATSGTARRFTAARSANRASIRSMATTARLFRREVRRRPGVAGRVDAR